MAVSSCRELKNKKETEQPMGNYCLMTNTYSIALLSFLLCVGEMMRVIEQLQHTATVPPLHSLCENFGSAGS